MKLQIKLGNSFLSEMAGSKSKLSAYTWYKYKGKKISLPEGHKEYDIEINKGSVIGIKTAYGKKYCVSKKEPTINFLLTEAQYKLIVENSDPIGEKKESTKAPAKESKKAPAKKEAVKEAPKKEDKEEPKKELDDKGIREAAKNFGKHYSPKKGLSKESLYNVTKLSHSAPEAKPDDIKKVFAQHGHDKTKLSVALTKTFKVAKSPDSTTSDLIGYFADKAGLN